ncbi:MAG: fatty acid desaturase [Pirellulaceae bacterium]|nr:fatty acid desaturase [Planctomycetales bacterium]
MATVLEKPNTTSNSRPADYQSPQLSWDQVSWPVAIWIAAIHLGVLAAPFFFSWQGLVLMFVWHWITGGLGVCLGFHRLLTHTSFETYRPVRFALSLLGGLAGEGSCLYWVANHRKHHAMSDQPGDPHSPHDGPWWSHMLWCMHKETAGERDELYTRWCPDLNADRSMHFLDRTFLLWHFVLGVVMGTIGYAWGGWYLATSLVVWGMFVRLTFVLHSTWFVNSASHMWGYRNYKTTDDSRNNWWVALLTYGEGWHNNHHAYPRMARHGHRWWEIDATFMTIRLMEYCGLAWSVVDQHHKKRNQESTVVREQVALDLANPKYHRPARREDHVATNR